VGILGELLTLLVYAAGSGDRPSIVNFLRLGAFLAYAFHHVGIVLEGAPAAGSGVALTGGSEVLVVLAPMLGTLLAAWLLARGGRTVATSAGGGTWARIVRGATIGLPYAVVAGAVSWAVGIPQDALAPGNPPIHPAHAMAFLWPLAIGVLAGAAGGFGSSASASTPAAGSRRIPPRLAAGAAAGGAWMLALGLVLSFAGLVLMAPLNPDATRAYLGVFDRGLGPGVAAVAFTVMVAPNMALLVLSSAMGACLTAAGAVGKTTFSYCLLSYSSFPSAEAARGLLAAGQATGKAPRLDLPGPPVAFFLFVLAPLAAVVVGGVVAARRGGATTRAGGALAGALAGVVFAGLVVVAAAIGTARMDLAARIGIPRLAVRAGPDLLQSSLFALAWGVAGGGLGGVLGTGSLRRRRRAEHRSTTPEARPHPRARPDFRLPEGPA